MRLLLEHLNFKERYRFGAGLSALLRLLHVTLQGTGPSLYVLENFGIRNSFPGRYEKNLHFL